MAGNDPLAGASADLASAATAYTNRATQAQVTQTRAADVRRQQSLDQQRKAREAALLKQQEDGQSWYGTLLDKAWTDDFSAVPIIGPAASGAATAATAVYEGWNAFAVKTIADMPGGVDDMTWDQARNLSVGQVGMLDMAHRMKQIENLPPALRAMGQATFNVASPLQSLSMMAINGLDPSNPLNRPDTFNPENETQKDAAFGEGFGKYGSGIADVIFTFYLDPLVLGGKAIKIARFGSDALGWAGLTKRQLTTAQNAKQWGAEVESGIAHLNDPTLPQSVANVHAKTMANGSYDELMKWDILEGSPFKQVIAAVGANITDEKDALTLLGALGGDPRYVGRLAREQAGAFDALTRAGNQSAWELEMLQNPFIGQTEAILDDIMGAHMRADVLLDDLIQRNKALQDALGVAGRYEGQPLLQNIGSRSVRYEKYKAAYNSGKANRTPNRLGGKDTRAKSWLDREDSVQGDTAAFVQEGRLTADEAARRAAAEDRRFGTSAAGFERVFWTSSHMRPVRVWSWATGQKASGHIDVRGLGVGDQSPELAAVFTDSKVIRQDAVFQNSLMEIWRKALLSGSPEARMQAVKTIEKSATTYLANHYGVSDKEIIDNIYAMLDGKRSQVVNQFTSTGKAKGRAYGVNPEDGSLITLDPVMRSQLETSMPMLDFTVLERSVKLAARPEYRGLKLAQDRVLAVNLMDEVASLWKASVLLRMGYTQRNVVEGWLRTAAVLGTIPALTYAPKALGRAAWSNRAWSARGRAASKYELRQKVIGHDLAMTREQIGLRQQEMFDYAASRNSFAPVEQAAVLEAQAARVNGRSRSLTRQDRDAAWDQAWRNLTVPGAKRPTQKAVKAEQQRILREEIKPNLPVGNDPVAGVYRLRALSARTQSNNYSRHSAPKVVRVAGQEVNARAVWRPSADARRIMDDHGIPAVEFVELSAQDAAVFHRALMRSKGTGKFGSSVTAYNPGQYRKMRMFVSKDGTVGFALKDGDEVVSAFAAGGSKNSGHAIKRLSIEQGGRRSDAFDTVLPDIYTPHGMTPVSRIRFDDSFAEQIGWNYDDYARFNGGRPDVVGFAYDPNRISRYNPGEGRMFDDYAQFEGAVAGAADDATLSSIREGLDALTRSESRLVARYEETIAMRKKYGKRKYGDDGAFAKNGGLYRDLASNQSTTERVLESAWGREASRAMENQNWVEVLPGQAQYWDELSRAAEQMRNDDLILQALNGADKTEMRAWFTTPEGRVYAKEMRLSAKEMDSRVNLLHDMAHTYFPNAASRRAVAAGALDGSAPVPSGTELAALLRNDDVVLSPIHGRKVASELGGARSVNEAIHKPINWLFKMLGTVPETVAVRQPFYNTVWQRRVAELTRIQKDRNGMSVLTGKQIRAIEENAHAFALQATNDTLYTIQRYSNPAHAMRFIAPFFPAWENSMRTWFGIVTRDPSVLARASMLWQIPNKMGLVVDEKGNKIESDPFAFGTGSINRYIMFPQALSDAFKKVADSQLGDIPGVGGAFRAMGENGFRVPQGSLNVVSPGSTPWLPGFGPMVVAPAGMYLESKPDQQAFLRKFLGDALYQQIAPFGVASGDVANTVLPPAARKAWQRWQGESSSEYLQVVDAMMRTAMVDWYVSGSRPEDKPSPDAIRQKANDFFLFGTIASLTLPVTLSRTSKYQVEIDAWNNLKATPGLTYPEKVEQFLELHGDSFLPLITSSSGSQSKDIDPTIETWNLLSENRGLVETLAGLGPEAIGIIGAAAPLGQFDQGSYNYWLNTDIPGQPGLKYKATLSPGEMQERIELSGAWREYNQLKAERDAALKARGGMTMEAASNADIKQQWQYTTDVYLRTKYGPAWTVALNDFQSQQGKYLEGIQAVLAEPTFTASQTPMWATVREYMDVRASAMAAIQSGSDASAVKDQFEAWAADLRFTSIEFADFFDNYLANDNLTIGVN